MIQRWVTSALVDNAQQFRRVRGFRDLPRLVAALDITEVSDKEPSLTSKFNRDRDNPQPGQPTGLILELLESTQLAHTVERSTVGGDHCERNSLQHRSLVPKTGEPHEREQAQMPAKHADKSKRMPLRHVRDAEHPDGMNDPAQLGDHCDNRKSCIGLS
jgi:hypothetical protein